MVYTTNELKLSALKKERALINRLLTINLPFKIIQSIIIYLHSREKKTIEIGNKNKKTKKRIDGITVIILQYCHYWGIIIVYLYYMWIQVLLGFTKQVNVFMSLQLDI